MNAPERIYGWRNTQLSIARFYGGLTYQGKFYVIAPDEEGEPLVRLDVHTAKEKAKRDAAIEKKRQEKRDASDAQTDLFFGEGKK
jgi:hypothetical protein